MIGSIQITLYEIFGYLIPGILATLSFAITYWAICLARVPFPPYKINPDVTGWVAIIGISYFVGHVIQGVGNRFLRGAEDAALGEKGSVPEEIRKRGRFRAAELIGVSKESVDAISLFRYADEYSVQKGQIGDRDIFVYREGFYKGCTISTLMLSISLFVRAVYDGAAIAMPTYVYFVSRKQLFFGACLAAVAARVCKQRFYRFGEHKVSRVLFAFLAALQLDAEKKDKEKKGT